MPVLGDPCCRDYRSGLQDWRLSSATAVAQNLFLHLVHVPRAGSRLIIETVQMEKTMDDIEAKLARERVSKRAGMSLCCLNADKDFAMLKSQHVGWPCSMHEFSM
jgi:hypothetical protein